MIGFLLFLAAIFYLIWRAPAAQVNPPVSSELSEAEARQILGVPDTAGTEDIQDAWKRLMQKNHPDQGGSTYLATQINEAKERLIGK